MKKSLTILLLATILVTLLAPVCAGANPATMFVYTSNGKVLHMRSAMVTGANNVVVDLPYGAEVDVISFVNATWARCSYNNYEGYCMRRYLVDEPPAPHKQGGSAPAPSEPINNAIFDGMKACYYTATVRPTHPTGYVNLRWAPTTSARIHDKYYAGSELVVMAENSKWCQVLDKENNIMGFMVRSFLVPN